jgi:protein O-GlcNAc transferase
MPILGRLLNGLRRGSSRDATDAAARAVQADSLPELYTAAQRAMAGGDLAGAVPHLRAILDAQDPTPELHCNLGVALRVIGELDEAAHHLQEACRLQPALAAAWYNLGLLEFDRACYAEAEQAYRKAIAAEPTVEAWQHSRLCLLNYAPGHDRRDVFEAHRAWARRFSAPRHTHAGRARPRDAERLRVGYVSADFRGHSVAFFIGPVLEHHDRGRFEIFCYDNWPKPDDTTARLRGYVEHWRPVHALDDDAFERVVRDDRIDLLVDLSGHTLGHRLPVFARKPAPVQATWIGYPQTTGLATIDYRISDAYLDPPGETDMYGSERLWRLPECAVCFLPPENAPQPGFPPSAALGAVTFGSINHYFKVTDAVVAVWSRILAAMPGARLRIVVEHGEQTAVATAVRTRFANCGVGPERIEVRGRTDLAGFFDQLADIDIALDPYPYNGGTTTYQSLWAGIPVVALAGTSAMSRCGVMILSAVGLSELVAASEDEYVAIATRLAGDRSRLAELRATLRGRYRKSPLYAAERFTRTLEDAYDAMWQEYCGQALEKSG